MRKDASIDAKCVNSWDGLWEEKNQNENGEQKGNHKFFIKRWIGEKRVNAYFFLIAMLDIIFNQTP
jgi:hypothetical protein